MTLRDHTLTGADLRAHPRLHETEYRLALTALTARLAHDARHMDDRADEIDATRTAFITTKVIELARIAPQPASHATRLIELGGAVELFGGDCSLVSQEATRGRCSAASRGAACANSFPRDRGGFCAPTRAGAASMPPRRGPAHQVDRSNDRRAVETIVELRTSSC
jgi:hypothetical protein